MVATIMEATIQAHITHIHTDTLILKMRELIPGAPITIHLVATSKRITTQVQTHMRLTTIIVAHTIPTTVATDKLTLTLTNMIHHITEEMSTPTSPTKITGPCTLAPPHTPSHPTKTRVSTDTFTVHLAVMVQVATITTCKKLEAVINYLPNRWL